MSNEDCPCRECEIRYTGCHAKCKQYTDFKEKLENLRKLENEFKLKNSIYHQVGVPGFGNGIRKARYRKPKDAYVN